MKKFMILFMMVLVLTVSSVGNVYASNSGSIVLIDSDDSHDSGGSIAGSTDVTTICNAIPDQITNVIGTIVTLIKIGVPIILIVMGMIDMGKAVASQKDDEIKKGQKTLISRVIAAGIVYFVVAIVQLLVNVIDSTANKDGNGSGIWTCVAKLVGSK